jgi:hypothetical protein
MKTIMIKLIGEKLRQYDLNRTVELIPKHGHTVDAVMFHRGPEPLMTAHREEDGKIVADIPNILLKSFGTLTVECHLIDENGYRISERASFYISKREMPADYAYEETPILTLGKGGGVSSWNDLMDKPFDENGAIMPEALPEGYPYKEMREGVLMDETTISLTYDEGANVSVAYNPFTTVLALERGNTYFVECNGVKYTCPCGYYESVNGTYIGNLGILGGDDNGMPFVIVYTSSITLVTVSGKQETLTVKVSWQTEVVHKMTTEFLPAVAGVTPLVFECKMVDFSSLEFLSIPTLDEVRSAFESYNYLIFVTDDTQSVQVHKPVSVVIYGDGTGYEVVFISREPSKVNVWTIIVTETETSSVKTPLN